jgi:hypothetical protein
MPPDALHRYGFRPVAAEDLPMLGAWLERPHVAAWWDDVEDKVAEIRQAMTDPATRPSSCTEPAEPGRALAPRGRREHTSASSKIMKRRVTERRWRLI